MLETIFSWLFAIIVSACIVMIGVATIQLKRALKRNNDVYEARVSILHRNDLSLKQLHQIFAVLPSYEEMNRSTEPVADILRRAYREAGVPEEEQA